MTFYGRALLYEIPKFPGDLLFSFFMYLRSADLPVKRFYMIIS
jgi:hypothetical protein